MRSPLLFTAIMVVCSIFVLGCSGEEQGAAPTRDAGVVKQAIVKPPAEKIQGPETKEAEGKESGPELTLEVSATPQQAQTRPQVEKRQDVLPAKAAEEPAKARPSTQPTPKETARSYAAEPGDTLAGIAAKKEIFGNPLKWAILYRMNAAALESLPHDDNLPDLPLPAGLKLWIAGPEETREKIDKRSGCLWVVNVVSAASRSEMVPAVISLAKKDYPVYVTGARVNEKDYMRVRVGFFKTREQADAESVKIREMLNLKDSWVTKVPTGEFNEFAGY